MKSFEDEIVKKIANRKGLDRRVVQLIERTPLKFFKEVSASDDDIRPVRLRYFGAFVPKTQYINEFNLVLNKENKEENNM